MWILLTFNTLQSGETSATATPEESQCSAGRIEEEVELIGTDEVEHVAPEAGSTLDSPPTSPIHENPRFRHYLKTSDPIPIG